ncbi:MAG: hypothetical protein DWQ05_10130 [Calditrichaeota bacterium]|nr:MAG: hypothetical protein DWQ05_10130 [Calditrichota bacterium]
MHNVTFKWRLAQFLLISGLICGLIPAANSATISVFATPAPGAKDFYKSAMKETDLNKKIELLLSAVKEAPDYIDALRELGLAYGKIANYTESEKYLLAAYSTNAQEQNKQQKILLLYELSQVYQELNRLIEGEESLRGALGLALESDDIWKLNMALAKNLVKQEKFNDAMLAANNANDSPGVKRVETVVLIKSIEQQINLRAIYTEATKAQKAENFSKAKELFDSILQTAGSKYKDVGERLSQVNAEISSNQNTQILENVYNKAVALEENGKNKAALRLYKNINFEGGYKDSAIRFENLAAQIDKIEQETELNRLYSQGIAAAEESNWFEAWVAFEEIIGKNPQFKDVPLRLAEAKLQVNKNQSESLLARFYAEGLAAQSRGELIKARTFFLKICKIDPNYEDAQILLEDLESKISEKKLTNSRDARISNPELEKLYLSVEKEISLKNWKRAIVLLEKIQIIEKGFLQSDTLLTYCKRQLFGYGDDSKANLESDSDLFLSSVILSIILVPLLGFLAVSPALRVRFLLAKKKYVAAAQIYEKILIKHPNRINIFPKLAHIYLLAGRKDDQAIKIYKMIMHLNLSAEYHSQISSILTQNYISETNTADADGIHLLEAALADEFKKKNKDDDQADGFTGE